ncbi:hypothetical protein VCRA2128O305_80059 [Vibrio crassostreae]|nr:hypothetical protein VCRA2110O177_100058 [Vibrio crassostreae]CAK1700860.1 hypothetical protein VCRA2110O181_100087 [Vibrio crassostreae]CAK1813017.1 hypothetical protein VCRA2112O191_170058 [Vibrio crassostreae]CAK1844973.1 hypothetical protein VCRA2113O120_10117 [Vibrio crassostreae]CAK2055025.1 hypothetical protein VCRA2113O322_30223 [Vibrio crassostreae]
MIPELILKYVVSLVIYSVWQSVWFLCLLINILKIELMRAIFIET